MNILVVGSGIMGAGIAITCARGGHAVVLNDLNDEILDRAGKNIDAQIALMADNKLLGREQAAAVANNIVRSADLEESASGADVVFEVIPEKRELKDALFGKLERFCPPDAVFATNTSGISIGILAQALHRRDRLVGTHFFNPASLIPLVEIVRGDDTSDEAVDRVFDLLVESGKKPVKIFRDVPGFVANRLQHALAREAMSLVQKGVATAEGIDEVMKYSVSLRLLFTGPMMQRDFNGLETHLSIASYLYRDLEDAHEPLKILEDKVREGKWGLKTGEGFYDWRGRDAEAVKAKTSQELIDVLKFIQSRE